MNGSGKGSWKSRLLLIYVIALLLSTGARLWRDSTARAGEEIHFLDTRAGSDDGRPVVLLLHGARGDASSMEPLIEELDGRGDVRVIALDLPGFGRSGREVEDLSAPAQARRVIELLRKQGVERAHVFGFGYGGVVALSVADQARSVVTSLTLASCAVAPQVDLLGDAALNRALALGQYAGIWLMQNALPHFGALDRVVLGESYAAAELQTDLEESAASFERWDGPLLIIGANGDEVVTLAELEIYGKVNPQAQFLIEDGARADLLREDVGHVAERFLAFSRGVENGPQSDQSEGGDRPRASFDLQQSVGLNPWGAATLLALATFVSEDLACIGGGLLAARGSITLEVAIVGCLFGIFIGDLAVYAIGRLFGASALKLPVLRRLATPAKLARAAGWFKRKGVWLVVLTRFFPGSRVPTYFAAGVVEVGVVRFGLALLLAAAVWTPILVGLAYVIGDRFMPFFEGLGPMAWFGVASFVLLFLLATRLLTACLTWRGRRLLYSRVRRLTAWEFWPIWAFYPPVVLYVIWLMVRHRSITLPTAVNPCMPASGLVYESKSQILSHLQGAGAPVARFAVLPLERDVEEKLGRLDAFVETVAKRYPVVLKPDVGQRGQGVAIVENREQARAFFEAQEEDTIVQEYVEGPEFGVFYHRPRSATAGIVSSVTDKRLVSVTGDGSSTLERLILADERAVCMARYFIEAFERQLEEVVPAGERVQLAEVGTHCRGALFLDGAALITPELCAEVDRFSREIPDFHFGRYDVRAPSREAFMRGEGLRIIELNGLTSEPTNMYDPKHSVFHAWRLLCRQWRLIFLLAKENRLAGKEPVSTKAVLRLTWAYLKGAPSRGLV